jgi:hypothetical protein
MLNIQHRPERIGQPAFAKEQLYGGSWKAKWTDAFSTE